MSLYDDLGVGEEATPEEVKRAYRRRAQKAHPDRGGDPEKFHAIQLAYEVLSDEARRARYDATGEAKPRDIRIDALNSIATIVVQIAEQLPDLDSVDLVAKMREVINHHSKKLHHNHTEAIAALAKYDRALAKLKHTGKGVNVLGTALRNKRKSIAASLDAISDELELGRVMLELLLEYEYEPTPTTPVSARGYIWTSGTTSTL